MGHGVFDDESMTFINQTYQRAGAFLFGRQTYEVFARSWGAIEEMRTHPIGVALNETPKYVASNTLTEPRWANTERMPSCPPWRCWWSRLSLRRARSIPGQ